MTAAARFAFIALAFLAVAPHNSAQFEKLRPVNYGVWSPQVGAGAIYLLESQGEMQAQELSVVGTEAMVTGTAYWLEMRVATKGKKDGIAFRQLFYESKKKLVTDHFIVAPFKGGAGQEFPNSWMGSVKITIVGLFSTADTPTDFRKRAKRIGTETVSTPAGAFDCEVWRMKKGRTTVWYSQQVKPFGLVKMTSQYGTVSLLWVISNAKQRIYVNPKTSPAATGLEATAAMRSVFPGNWLPMVGQGAAYELENGSVRQDVEFTVVGSERRESELLHWLEVYAPCTARGIEFSDGTPGYYYTDPNTGESRWEPGNYGSYFTIAPYNGRCTNKFLVTTAGLIAAEARALYSRWDVDQDGYFSVLELLQIKYGPPTWHPTLSKRPSDRAPTQPELPDFRKQAVLLGTEVITTPAGTFTCEHWRSVSDKTDIWLSAEVPPLGLVKKSSASGNVALVRIITNAKPRLRENQAGKNPELYVELQPQKKP
ncbi:MAG: hypothetical protein HYR58_00540 [Acidobacteria bacterium]|nr:hypothetical protein [Acidobacteriota bacterium]